MEISGMQQASEEEVSYSAIVAAPIILLPRLLPSSYSNKKCFSTTPYRQGLLY